MRTDFVRPNPAAGAVSPRYAEAMNTSLFVLLFACNGADDAGSTPTPSSTEASPEAESDPMSAPPDVAEPPADASTTESGLAYRVLKAGTGTDNPSATSEIEVHYTGWQTDGTMFDSSHKRGRPLNAPLNRMIHRCISRCDGG